MSVGSTVIIILLGSLLFFGIYAWVKIRRKMRDISQMAFGTDDLIEGFKQQELLTAEQPKNVSGITRLALPQIEADFPEFHWLEWKQRCEQQLIEYLESLEAGEILNLEDCSESLKEEIRQELEDRRQRNVKEKFDAVVIHNTQISEYKKESGLCSIIMQSAVEYRHTLEGDPKIQDKKEQHRYYMRLFYVQDMDKAGIYESVHNAVCSNCGAPIKKLGAKYCEYCGSALEVWNLRVWSLNKIEKRD